MGEETKSSKTENVHRHQADLKHPDEYQADLSPNRMAGQNVGPLSADSEVGLRTAYDVKEVHRSLNHFEDDDLKQIPVLEEGMRLQQGATYLDLRNPSREEFTATGDTTVDREGWYVAKDTVPYSIWNRLRGVEDPERTLEGNRGP